MTFQIQSLPPSLPSSSTLPLSSSLSTLAIIPTRRRVGRPPQFGPESLTSNGIQASPLSDKAGHHRPLEWRHRMNVNGSSDGNERLERENVRMREKKKKKAWDRKQKAEGVRPSLPSLTWVREGDMSGCRDDVNKHSEEGETSMLEYVRSPLRFPQQPHVSPPLPCQLTTPNVPPSAPSKRITSNFHMVRIRTRSHITETQVWNSNTSL